MDRRAVITGLGIVSPLGIGKEENWKQLTAGVSGIKQLTRFETKELQVTIAGEIRDFKAKDFIKDRKAIKLSQPMVHLAIAASQL
ncbi:MAG: beta-ketoacyl synthase N-terminal-like domain-containing protein, partial [Thermodesulfobacteriota bacterium]|nr:beta-ketoacyl synthase N-terminal-like domain-containing protein [Thermodesulfobacteriota bacterium]